MNKKFTLKDFMRILMKHWWVFLVSLVFCFAGLYLLNNKGSETEEMQFQTSAQVLVYPTKQNTISMATLADVVRSKDVLGDALKKYNHRFKGKALKYTELKKILTTAGGGDSQVITITVSDKTEKRSKYLVTEISKEFAKDVKKLFPVQNVSIISRATAVEGNNAQESMKHSEKMSTKKLIVFAIAAGLILGVIVAFTIEITTNVLRKK